MDNLGIVVETIGSPAVRYPTLALTTYIWLNMGAPVPFAGNLLVPNWFRTDYDKEPHRQAAIREYSKRSQEPTMETVTETIIAKLHLPGPNVPTNDIFGVPNTLSFSPSRQPFAWSGPADRTAYACRGQFLGSSPTSPLLSLLSLLSIAVLAVYHLTTRHTITKLKQQLAEAKTIVKARDHSMDSLTGRVDGLIENLDAEMRRLGIVHPKKQTSREDVEDMASAESIKVALLTDTVPPPSLLIVPDTLPVDELDSAPALSNDNTGSGGEHGGFGAKDGNLGGEHGGPDGEDGEFGGEAGVADTSAYGSGTKKKRRNNKKPRAVKRAAAAAREAAAAEE
jgi:hypothetical protein